MKRTIIALSSPIPAASHPRSRPYERGAPERNPFTVAEYFAGIGLFRMGLEAAGWRVVYANDWSEERAQIYRGFFGDAYRVEDVFSVSPDEVPRTALATCSFPCTDLSLAGKLEGINGNQSGAFWGFCDILAKQGGSAPPIVLLENVVGWLHSNGGADFRATAKALNELGYACDAFMLNALSFVPQSRPRIFMVGVKAGGEGDFAPHIPDSRSKRLTPDRLRKLILESDDIRWTRLAVPEPPDYMTDGFSRSIAERVPPDDSRWWASHEVERHLAMMSPPHLAMVKRMAGREEERFRTFFRRVRAGGQRAEVRRDDIAGCLRTVGGGSGRQFMVAAGSGALRMRALTPREYARLQGVPDSFPITAKTECQALNAFGDAVCAPAVSWIAEKILTPLARRLSIYK